MYLYRLIVLSLLVSGSTYITWYGGNYYAAGLVDQTMLIEFDMDDDFWYCYNVMLLIVETVCKLAK